MDASFLTFLGVSVIVIVTPGPDTALTIRNALLTGRGGGVYTAFGVSTGQLIWAAATSLGLVALLLASEPIFRALKFAGAAYLIYLGILSLRAAVRGSPAVVVEASGPLQPHPSHQRAFRQGVINNLANPKTAVFFASVLPQFAPPGIGMLSGLMFLGFIFAALTFAWLALYAIAIAAAGTFVHDSAIRRAVDGIAGIVLVGPGVRIATDEH